MPPGDDKLKGIGIGVAICGLAFLVACVGTLVGGSVGWATNGPPPGQETSGEYWKNLGPAARVIYTLVGAAVGAVVGALIGGAIIPMAWALGRLRDARAEDAREGATGQPANRKGASISRGDIRPAP